MPRSAFATGQGEEPALIDQGDQMTKGPFVIDVKQLLSLFLRLPVWRLSADHHDVRAVAHTVFRRAARAAYKALCFSSRYGQWTRENDAFSLERSHVAVPGGLR